jgi:hypothetical protein
MSRSSLGVPFDRLQGAQGLLGGPVPDATQWDPLEKVGDWGEGGCASLETLAAPGARMHQDATSVRRLSRIDENRTLQAQAQALGVSRATERTGRYTTAVVVTVGEQPICLSAAGRAQAGENRTAWWLQRQADRGTPLGMSAALARHEVDETRLLRCHCLAHGRRQCSERADVFPQACAVGIEARTPVLDPDDPARAAQRRPEARCASHQASSRPIMDERTRCLAQPCADRLVAPTRSWGKAMASRQGHGDTLPRF